MYVLRVDLQECVEEKRQAKNHLRVTAQGVRDKAGLSNENGNQGEVREKEGQKETEI